MTVGVALDAGGALPDYGSSGSGGGWEGLARLWEGSMIAQGGRRCENSGGIRLVEFRKPKCRICVADLVEEERKMLIWVAWHGNVRS